MVSQFGTPAGSGSGRFNMICNLTTVFCKANVVALFNWCFIKCFEFECKVSVDKANYKKPGDNEDSLEICE